MSVAAAGGSDGGDKKGKWKVPESLLSPIEEEMEKDDDHEEVPSSGIENLDALKQSLPHISRKEAFRARAERRSESLRQHITYFRLRERELRGRSTIKKRRNRLKHIYSIISSSRNKKRRASSLPPPPSSLHDHHKDVHHDHDDDEKSMALDSKMPNK